MKNKVLIIAVHPDDETLGCGGTLLKHKANGDEIHWLICTTIDKKHDYYETREKEIEQVSKLYKFDTVYNLRLKTMQVDEYSMSELISKISKVVNEIKPTIIYLPFKGDVHSDHRKIFESAYSCTKSFRYPFIKKIYMIETLSETEFAPSTKEDTFIPNFFVDISEYLEEKIKIMKIFESEIIDHPFPRSEKNLRALATLRGATSGCEYAECFVLLKEIS
ncbi:PIG-L deacetylase family protein [Arcobacter sp.]|uniref:PIG-L deacetylase family protein n=1 Tax=unclassified Arcobacter TaxID=2593671 RepID=UPI003AFFB149|eukprot:TRINITY_DN61_c0_g1_i11.p4 TRINITY_DN61_c0_g1~~TRINITY_DN61_c0_g1_i11.p4  ORF type:complete len:220 (-),score=-36.76 TRINITY_DN61_c0_g1_i11:4441-5100(-)